MKLTVLGDSYVTPGFCVQPEDSFWGLLAKDLNIETIDNYANPGFSLDGIIHILLNEDIDFSQGYFIVGVPPIMREVYYSEEIGHKLTLKTLDNFKTKETPISCLENVYNIQYHDRYSNDHKTVNMFSAEWHEVQTIEKIYLIHQFLLTKQAKFVILNLSSTFCYQDMWPAGKEIIKKVYNLKECNLFKNTYQTINKKDNIKPADFDQYVWLGHHGSEGNLNYYNKVIKPMVTKLGW